MLLIKIAILAFMALLEIEGLGKIYYHEYGSGPKLMFAFHGYGMTGKQFNVLEKSLLKKYRIIGFDHFFHGTSELYVVNEASILAGMQPNLLNMYLKTWFQKFGEQRFSLMGYSIGANMALYLLENFAEKVDEIILIAPDGLVAHKGFQFMRTSFIGKKLFQKLTYSNWMMIRALKLLKQLKVIDQSLYAIAYREIDTPEKRRNAYFTVNFTKNIRPNVEKVATLINQYHINCQLFFGKYDNLFPKSNSRKFVSLLNQHQMHELPLGHWLVTTELDNYLTQINS